MSELTDLIVVEDVAGTFARLSGGEKARDQLLALGFIFEDSQWVRAIRDEQDRLKLISQLIDLKAAFAGGPGWSPESVIEDYRDRGELVKPYLRIEWDNPATYSILEIPAR